MGQVRYAKHSAEFRAEAVRLARAATEPLARIAREVGVKESTLRMWVKDAEPDERRRCTKTSGVSSADCASRFGRCGWSVTS
jgi:transposase-like protein